MGMEKWSSSYKLTMQRTRWVSIIGVVFVLLLTVSESTALYRAFADWNFDLPGDLWSVILVDLFFCALIGIASTVRICFLVKFDKERYLMQSISWLILASALVSYIALDYYRKFANCLLASDGICFSFYDSVGRTDSVLLASVVFLFASFLRFLITAVLAFFLTRRNFE
jgi:Na+/H+-translocating membrane pyrophosphatase